MVLTLLTTTIVGYLNQLGMLATNGSFSLARMVTASSLINLAYSIFFSFLYLIINIINFIFVRKKIIF
jgi:hypothetical protein